MRTRPSASTYVHYVYCTAVDIYAAGLFASRLNASDIVGSLIGYLSNGFEPIEFTGYISRRGIADSISPVTG